MQNKRTIGTAYEKVAGAYRESKGDEVLMYNFRCRSGEIDIVAKQDGYLVFVEVKYRKHERKGHPFDAVSLQKQRTISRCAEHYLKQHRLYDIPVRFDVLGILGTEIMLIQNAFDFVR